MDSRCLTRINVLQSHESDSYSVCLWLWSFFNRLFIYD